MLRNKKSIIYATYFRVQIVVGNIIYRCKYKTTTESVLSVKAKERRRYTVIGVTRFQLERVKVGLQLIVLMVFTDGYWDCLKKNLNASKPSEHSPDSWGKSQNVRVRS